ncbi:MAG: preprotein translocase subunit SecE [Candidatus Saccharimonadales bacterium]
MAEKKKPSSSSGATVTRIKATDTTPSASVKTPKQKSAAAPAEASAKTPKAAKNPRKRSAKGILRPFVAAKNYFTGAWYELKQVRWPTRKATWSMTLAVLIYSAFFVVLVVLLDITFQYLFDIILGK